VLSQVGCFERPVDARLILSARRKIKRAGVDAAMFWRSVRQSRGRVYFAATFGTGEALVCLEHSRLSEGDPPKFLTKATRHVAVPDGDNAIIAYVSPLTSENLLLLAEQEQLGILPQNLKTTPRLGLGVRMLFSLPPLLEAVEKADFRADFQLSGGREFSLREVIKALPGRYPEWLGHTGLYADLLYGTIVKECFKFGRSTYGTEIDHLIVSTDPSSVIARIRGHAEPNIPTTDIDRTMLDKSVEYCQRVIEEATRTGLVVGMTTDVSALSKEPVDDSVAWSTGHILSEYERILSPEERDALLAWYHPGTPHVIADHSGMDGFELTFSDEELARLAVKYRDGLLVNKRLYEHMKSGMRGRSFNFELSLDEAYKTLTTEKELFFYLSESARMGMRADLVAPNVGFRKREDHSGDLGELESRIHRLAVVAWHFGAILDFHSGSDKRPEVYQAISRACNGKLKLKMSAIFQLLFFETLASFRPGTEERKTFERVWDYTLCYTRKKAAEGDSSAQCMIKEFDTRTHPRRCGSRSPRDEFFRHYSFITVAARNRTGRYLFRHSLYRLAEKPRVAKKYNRRVIMVTCRVARALGLAQTARPARLRSS